jgi:catechol 2,3-dioxygenase-like lactoylglutathione lyase family enzyme
MLGTIYEWFYTSVLGLKVIEDGYRSFEIDPPYGAEFGHVNGTVDCPYGLIDIDFRQEKDSVVLNVVVPFGTTARVRLPGAMKSYNVERAGSSIEASGETHFTVGHGSYIVQIQL